MSATTQLMAGPDGLALKNDSSIDRLMSSVPGFLADVLLHIQLTRPVDEDVGQEGRHEDRPGPFRETPVPAAWAIPEVLPHHFLLVWCETLRDLSTRHLEAITPPDGSFRRHGVSTNARLVPLGRLTKRVGRTHARDGSAQR
mmetsp:Transcript_60171/g.110226  ORF Transcript_60171/g.110226 Transcript_60171/m.110226 type:complete len:142 (+) Transcript_60171:2-427(+)